MGFTNLNLFEKLGDQELFTDDIPQTQLRVQTNKQLLLPADMYLYGVLQHQIILWTSILFIALPLEA